MEELQETARRVIRALRSVDDGKYSNLRVAVIGGLARMYYCESEERVTKDVDFIVDIPGLTVTPELKTAISRLPNSGFSMPTDVLYCGYTTPKGTAVSHQVDFIARDICPYLPSAAQRVQDIAEGDIPYISRPDLIVFKIFSCGLRATTTRKGGIDAEDAEQAIVEDRIDDVVSYFEDRPRSWWRERLGLPEEDGGADSKEEEDQHEHEHEQHDEKEDRKADNEGDKGGDKKGVEGSSEEDVKAR
ncbi:hypothetical protein C8A03DRAFT_31301 [Achaetomium macrosporum]|uniref:Uncharacterized protein n=1 Tax=Achaetomium macrosporum TaxID=79813 RepID=A0AAN7CF22_9PEZI|nr:hypothetical protein C8A03DRAFT_31301 [Achaetomium macrosporum]